MAAGGEELDGASRWCPICGAEYLPHIAICADCGVPLADSPPAPVDHETLTYDFAEWDEVRRRGVELLPTGAAITFGWEHGTDLVVPRSAEAAVDELIEELEAMPPDVPSPRREGQADAEQGRDHQVALAGIGQRFLARALDTVILFISSWVLFTLSSGDTTAPEGTGEALPPWWWGALLLFVYEAGPTAIWGQTLGKRILRIRVVGPDGDAPGWLRATRRWLVPFGLSLIPYFGFPLALGAFLRAAFVPDRRGVHDLAAGTAVVRTRTR